MCFFMQPPPFKAQWNLFRLSGDGLQPARERGCHWANVKEAKELLGQTNKDTSTRLIRFNIENVSVL